MIGFPHGGQATSTKIAESEKAIADGAIELDMVINISAALSGQWQYITREIDEIVSLAHANQRKVKVIFENCYLSDDQKQRLCEICCELKADWIKTSKKQMASPITLFSRFGIRTGHFTRCSMYCNRHGIVIW